MAEDAYIEVDGIRTHYWTAGDRTNPAIVLVHGGEFGGSAELSFERNFDALAEKFFVVAPDMIGFGLTDKVVEFGLAQRHARRIRHLARFLEVFGVDEAHFVGNSLGGAVVLNDLASDQPRLPVLSLTSICGAPPNNDHAWAVLQGFDGTEESMRRILDILFVDPVWTSDSYLQRKMRTALVPGAYEAAMAARLTAPSAVPTERTGPRPLPLHRVGVKALFIEGKHEKCCPGFSEAAAKGVQNGRFVAFDNSAHCAQLEQPERFHAVLFDFLGVS